MKIYLINETLIEREWLAAALKMINESDTVVCLERGYELEVEESSFASALVIVTQEQFPALRRQLSKSYAATELPCPILILSESFDSFDVSGYRHATLDAFPMHAITPPILKYLLSTLKRDFRKELRLKRLAHYDTLTGATNRYLFSDRAKQAIAASKRQSEVLSFMYFDLDKFKSINDQYGHNAGDEYLKSFVDTIMQNIRDTDTLGRLGGDEFGLLLPKVALYDAEHKAQQILKALSIKRPIGDKRLSISTSIGLVTIGEKHNVPELNYKNLVGLADSAAFAAKKKGSHRYEIYKPKTVKHINTAMSV